ncbi:MAG: hypothetical protein BWY31_04222 [Lentisphaerae bacterium ADurb.Bin242]|nr:MAG: hypothetical protein BWY31_04222 [Lentisphaerae bacterium ADurb.Bin242]
MKNERNIFKELDCLSLSMLLAMNWNEPLFRKILARHEKQRTPTGRDCALMLYQLHRECHVPDSPVSSVLIRYFTRRYGREIERLKSIPFEVSENKMLEETSHGIGVNPGAMFWAMALDERAEMQSLLIYHAHRLLLHAFQGENGSVFQCEKIRAENKLFREQLHSAQESIAELKMKLARAEAENAELRRNREETSAMKRELRMLRYQFSHGRPLADSFDGESTPCEKLTVIEADSPCPSRHAACGENPMNGKCTLANLKVALIGGLSRMENQYRSVFATLGAAKFYFHSGCCDGSGADRLRQATKAADIVVFITRVNSHNALDVIKGVCRKSGKSFLAVRETSPEAISRLLLEKLQIQKFAEPGCGNAGRMESCSCRSPGIREERQTP